MNVWKMHVRPLAYALAFALVIATLLWSLVARAEPGLVLLEEFAAPTAEEFLARGALSALLVMIAVRFVRQLLPLAADGSLRAKRITAALAVAVGLVLGWAGVAPAVAAGIAGKLLGGFGVGGLAYFGAGMVGPKGRMEAGLEAES